MKYLSTSTKKLGKSETIKPVIEREEKPGADLERIKGAVVSGKRKIAVEYTQKAMDQGADPEDIINNYLIAGLNIVGDKFEKKKIFVPEMMMAAKSMQACVDLVKPFLKKDGVEKTLGTVVIGTVLGDLHDIGKNLTKLLLETSDFRVIDLGENIPPDKFVNAARDNNAHIVGLSSLLTTGDPHVEETIKALKISDISDKVKVFCGSAALTLKFVEASGSPGIPGWLDPPGTPIPV
jgi:5-methyltetrahydrofolate--homocysteine methyltransferase